MEIHSVYCFRQGFVVRVPYYEVIESLDQAKTVEAVWNIAESFFVSHNITHAIYVYCRDYRSPASDTIIFSTLPNWWVNEYRDNGYGAIDPFFTYCCETYNTVRTGIEYYDEYEYLSEGERHFIKEASKTGFTAGTTFIMRRKGIGKDFGGWNLGTNLTKADFESLYSLKGEMLRIVAMYIHERLTILLKKDEEETQAYQKQVLTERQIECLSWLAQGLRTQQIADAMSVQPITVEHHLKQAREKLKASTREQALARAIQKGWVKLSDEELEAQ